MAKRKRGKYYNAEGFCEVCGSNPVALHHVKSYGSGGSDDSWNLAPLCVEHHNEIHSAKMGTAQFAIKYHKFETWLIENGWEYDDFTERWTHEN